jgi:hypothetical protein
MLEAAGELVDEGHHGVAIVNGEAAVYAEVALNIDDEQNIVAHHFRGQDRHVCSLP